MAGHSKWANIKHKKAATDAKRGKIFTRLIKEITVASRLGGSDVGLVLVVGEQHLDLLAGDRAAGVGDRQLDRLDAALAVDVGTNPRMRLAVDKAYENNMPKDTVERAIKRGSGELEGVSYEEVRYEGYGIAGAAVMVDCLTDNKTRTVADVRHAFTKYGGNLGTDGSVAFLFKHCGQLMFAPGTNEDKLMEAALDAGAEDVITNDDGSFEVVTGPYDFAQVKEALAKAGLKAEFAEVSMKPSNEAELTGEDAVKMQKLLDALEALDDVQDVYTTALIGD